MLKIAFIQVSFLHFFVEFYQNYIFLLKVVFQCKNYSEITVETRTQLKSVISTTDIFAVHCNLRFLNILTLQREQPTRKFLQIEVTFGRKNLQRPSTDSSQQRCCCH